MTSPPGFTTTPAPASPVPATAALPAPGLPTPGLPTPGLPTSEVAAAADHLQVARGVVDDAAATLRLAARQAGDSSVAEACRAEIAQVTGGLDATGATLDQAVVVSRSATP